MALVVMSIEIVIVFLSLADLATFVQHIQDKYTVSPKAQWICFGGSYPGALSAWFRLKVKFTVLILSFRIISKVWANSIDPEQSDQGLHCMSISKHLLNVFIYGNTT